MMTSLSFWPAPLACLVARGPPGFAEAGKGGSETRQGLSFPEELGDGPPCGKVFAALAAAAVPGESAESKERRRGGRTARRSAWMRVTGKAHGAFRDGAQGRRQKRDDGNVAHSRWCEANEAMVDYAHAASVRPGRQIGKPDAAGCDNRKHRAELRRERDLRCYGIVGVQMVRFRDLVAINRQAHALRLLSPQR